MTVILARGVEGARGREKGRMKEEEHVVIVTMIAALLRHRHHDIDKETHLGHDPYLVIHQVQGGIIHWIVLEYNQAPTERTQYLDLQVEPSNMMWPRYRVNQRKIFHPLRDRSNAKQIHSSMLKNMLMQRMSTLKQVHCFCVQRICS